MSVFIRKVRTGSDATAVQIVTKRGRQVVGVEHIGSAHTDVEVALLVQTAQLRKRQRVVEAGQGELDLGLDGADRPVGAVMLASAHSRLLFDALKGVYQHLGFDGATGDDRVFRDLVIARLIEPASKLDTIRILHELGLPVPSNSGIHRCLTRVAQDDYRTKISKACVSFRGVEQLTLVLYDVTTLFFQVEREDDYRKPGLSKERRLEPQIVVGLLVDERGFPLQVHSFEGNKTETLTLIPVLSAFRQQHPNVKVAITCDAGMLSAGNLDALEDAGFDFIVGSRIAKTPYDIAEYHADGREVADGQIFDTTRMFGSRRTQRQRRVVYQYRAKRARLDMLNIEKQVAKAQKVIDGKTQPKTGKFLKITGSTRELNDALIASTKQRTGIKGYVTNLTDTPAETIIASYHQLFNVEASFRMAKTDLRARPIYHRVKEKIDAHLTIVFTAIAIARIVQETTGVSIKKFVKLLTPIKDGILLINNKPHPAPGIIPEHIHALLNKLP